MFLICGSNDDRVTSKEDPFGIRGGSREIYARAHEVSISSKYTEIPGLAHFLPIEDNYPGTEDSVVEWIYDNRK